MLCFLSKDFSYFGKYKGIYFPFLSFTNVEIFVQTCVVCFLKALCTVSASKKNVNVKTVQKIIIYINNA